MTRKTFDIVGFVKDNYFTVAIFFCIILAELAPWLGARGGLSCPKPDPGESILKPFLQIYVVFIPGPLVPEITVKYFAVFIIFFSSGLTVKWSELSRAVKQYQLHIFIQAFSFLYIPIFVQIFLLLFEHLFELNSWIHRGLIIVGCMPPPVSSAVILVKSIGGNEAAAVFNSALGSILGILCTPLLLLLHVGISSSVPISRTVIELVQSMIFPVFLGQLSQRVFHPETLSKIPFSVFGQISLLFIIYSSFCDMFVQDDFSIDAHLILTTIFLVVTIQLFLMLSIFQFACLISKKSQMCTVQDVITITFCSTHKSLTLGMPLMKTLYGGYSHLSLISLPLLIYHPVQLILGGFFVPHGRKWVKKHSKSSSAYKRP